MEEIKGHRKILEILNRIAGFGRGLILEGKRGIGKFSIGVTLAKKILDINPFLSNDFLYYRNDDFLLKTRFFLKYSGEDKRNLTRIENYFFYFFSRTLKALQYNEISNLKLTGFSGNKVDLYDFINEGTNLLIEKRFIDFLLKNEINESLLKISENISKKSVIPINFIREWKEFDSFKKNKKVVIVGDFENANIEAQNSALKILEEPSMDTLVILTTSDISRILPTIISRCIVLKLHPLHPENLSEIFNIDSLNKRNTIDFMKDYLDSYSLKIKDITNQFFTQILPNINKSSAVFDFSEKISKESGEFVLSFLNEIIEFLRELHLARQFYIRKSPMLNNIGDNIKKLCPKTCTYEIHNIAGEVLKIIEKLKFNENLTSTLILNDLFIKIARWYQKVLFRKNFL